jgi:hypothetical protein
MGDAWRSLRSASLITTSSSTLHQRPGSKAVTTTATATVTHTKKDRQLQNNSKSLPTFKYNNKTPYRDKNEKKKIQLQDVKRKKDINLQISFHNCKFLFICDKKKTLSFTFHQKSRQRSPCNATYVSVFAFLSSTSIPSSHSAGQH